MTRSSSPTAADNERMFCAIVSGADRRQEHRRPIGALASIRRVIDGETLDRLDIVLRDVSRHGIGLRSPVPLPGGAVYRVELGTEEDVRIRIIHSRRRFDGTYDVGACCVAA